MELENPKIYDIVHDRSSEGFRLFQAEIDAIRNRDFKLKPNYENINLDAFYSFTVLTDSGKLVAFSGLQRSGPWEKYSARLSSRFYISPNYQTRGMLAYKFAEKYQSSYHTGSKYLNPYQIQVARGLGLKGVFISREYPLKRRSLPVIAERCAHFDPTGSIYEVLPVLMNVRRGFRDGEKYWQNIITVKFSDEFVLGLPEMTIDEWKRRFQVKA